jgi:hypothetical protein
LGRSIAIVLCAGSTLLLTPVVRPANSQPTTPSEVTPFSYWSIKPWFLTEGKLADVLSIPSSWGSPTVCNLFHGDKHTHLEIGLELNSLKEVKIEEIPVINEFQDVFPKELLGMPPDREIEFTIDLIPGTTPIA